MYKYKKIYIEILVYILGYTLKTIKIKFFPIPKALALVSVLLSLWFSLNIICAMDIEWLLLYLLRVDQWWESEQPSWPVPTMLIAVIAKYLVSPNKLKQLSHVLEQKYLFWKHLKSNYIIGENWNRPLNSLLLPDAFPILSLP